MAPAVRLKDGILTQVEVPELLVAQRSGFNWSAVKQAESVTLTPGNIITAKIVFHRAGWYLINGDPELRPAGSTTPPIFPAQLVVQGPWA